jgi:hypothetical protein
MSEEPIPLDKLLQGAERLAAEGNKEAARLALAEALRSHSHSLQGWIMLAKLTEDTEEEAACLDCVLRLDPQQSWASQRLNQIAPPESTQPANQPAPAAEVTEPPPAGDAPLPGATAETPWPEGPAGPEAPGAPATEPLQPQAGSAMPAHEWMASGPLADDGGGRLAPVVPQRRRRAANPVVVFFGAALILLLLVCGLTGYAMLARAFSQTTANGPTDPSNCQTLIRAALLASQISCTGLGPNQVCYGNTTLNALLVPGATGRFRGRGDLIDVGKLHSLKASALDPAADQWGIALFKLLANVPRAQPSQNVTFMVFGNTSLANDSGNLLTFEFSSPLGKVVCSRIPFDGIVVQVPPGAGITFDANGAEITLAGTAALEAHPDDHMTVSLALGSASISANGQTEYFGAGEGVQVPLGGPTGLVASGPPTKPDVVTTTLTLVCSMLGLDCNGQVQAIDPGHAATAIALAVATSTPSPSPTIPVKPASTVANLPSGTATASPKPGASSTGTVSPSASGTPLTPSGSPSATPSGTALPTATASTTPPPTQTFTLAPTWTPSATVPTNTPASPTNTSVPPTATSTLPPSPTFTPSATRTATPTAPTRTPTTTATGTPTSTATMTLAPSDTPTATATFTPSPTSTPSNTPPACQLAAGTATTNARNLHVPIQNNGASTVTVISIVISWPQGGGQQLRSVWFGGTQIDGTTYITSPSNIPAGGTWTMGQPADRQLAAGAGKDLQFTFRRVLPPTGYAVTVNFDNGCSVSANK